MAVLLTPDLLDGLTVIGLIALMSITICPLLQWVLTVEISAPDGSPASSTLHEKTT